MLGATRIPFWLALERQLAASLAARPLLNSFSGRLTEPNSGDSSSGSMIDNAARGGAVEGGGVARIEASDDDMLWFESWGVNGDVVAAVSAPALFMGVRIIDELFIPTC